MKLLLVLLTLCVYACDSSTIAYRHVVPEELRQEQRVWVLECIGRANPQSDEEPEDWVRMCHVTSIELYGVRTKGINYRVSGKRAYWESI